MTHQYRYYFQNLSSPTQYNISKHLNQQGFIQLSGPDEADFSDINLSLNEHDAQHLEFKHLLAEMINQHCSDIMPLTYPINDHNHQQVLTKLRAKHYIENGRHIDYKPNLAWIYKPSMMNNGENIHIFDRYSQLINHYSTNRRLGGDHVIQQYIVKPHLLNGHKYTLRMFVIMTNYDGVFIYRHGYFNIALQKYPSPGDYTDLSPHITNEHLRHAEANVIQMPTHRVEHFESIYQQIRAITEKTAHAINKTRPGFLANEGTSKFAVFGYDFILDDQLKCWLLEINHGPCFPKDEKHILQEHLYHAFWEAVVSNFIIPTVSKSPFVSTGQYPDIFERINI